MYPKPPHKKQQTNVRETYKARQNKLGPLD